LIETARLPCGIFTLLPTDMSTPTDQIPGYEKPSSPTRRSLSMGLGLFPLLPLLPACGGGAATAPQMGSADALPDAQAAEAVIPPVAPAQAQTPTPTPAPAPASPQSQPASVTGVFKHPGLLHTQADLQRMHDKVGAGVEPWAAGYGKLLAARWSDLGMTPNPVEVIIRGGADNWWVMTLDMQRAYHLALRWKITGDEAYARESVRFLNAWSSTLKELAGDSNRYLASGLYGNQWAQAAELMRNYPGWAEADQARFRTMLLNIFYPLCHQFITEHNGTETRKITHYWANWDLANLCGAYAIGVFCDRADITAEVVDYYKGVRRGRGNGASAHNVYYVHPGHMGQWQESHRDQGHSTLGIALAGMLCEMAWNQGEDLYGHWNNRLLAGAEYVARTNLKDANGTFYTMPFAPYTGVWMSGTAVAGMGSSRPNWELIYHHYVSRKGLSAPWTEAMLGTMRPERADGSDQPGLGTLLYTRDAAPAAKPSGLTAFLAGGKVLLSWWGSADAAHYLVQRASSSRGPFTTVAQVTDPRTHTDAPARGTWYYRITAVTASGSERIGAETARVAVPGELWLHLPLNGDAADASGQGRHATLQGSASFVEGRGGSRCLQFDGQSGYVALPDGLVSTLGDFTVAMWVYSQTTAVNTRLFDFGSDDVAYVALSPRSGSDQALHFLASREQFHPKQELHAAPLPNDRWVHVAVTLSGTVGTLYVDGAPVASHDGIWMTPYQMGHTKQTWLGRSQYGGDRLFKGRMQDVRIYAGALSAAEIGALAK
jgi:hypothetical protein